MRATSKGVRRGTLDLVLPRLNYTELGLGPPLRRVRVGYTGYVPRNCTRVMDSKTDPFRGLRGPELVTFLVGKLPNADIRVSFLRLQRKSRPRCGARCRDGHACRAPAVWDVVRDRPVSGRCRLHGGLSTGPKTPEGKERCAEGRRAHWAARRAEREAERLCAGEHGSDLRGDGNGAKAAAGLLPKAGGADD